MYNSLRQSDIVARKKLTIITTVNKSELKTIQHLKTSRLQPPNDCTVLVFRVPIRHSVLTITDGILSFYDSGLYNNIIPQSDTELCKSLSVSYWHDLHKLLQRKNSEKSCNLSARITLLKDFSLAFRNKFKI